MKKDLKQIGIFSLFLMIAILIVVYVDQKNQIDAQLFKSADLESTDIQKSWESFKKELGIQGDQTKIENFQVILEEGRIYSVEFNLIHEKNDEWIKYRYMECLLCKEGERERNISKTTLENDGSYDRDLVNGDSFFDALNRLQQEGMIDTIDNKYKMIASDGVREEVGVEGTYYILENDGLKRVDKSKKDTYSGYYYLHVMGNNDNKQFGTSDDSKTIFFEGQSE